MTKSPALKQEFEFYLENQENFVARYLNKYIVIKGREVIGSYDSESDAYFETQKSHELGSFLIQHVEPGTGSYTQTYYSRVAIPV